MASLHSSTTMESLNSSTTVDSSLSHSTMASSLSLSTTASFHSSSTKESLHSYTTTASLHSSSTMGSAMSSLTTGSSLSSSTMRSLPSSSTMDADSRLSLNNSGKRNNRGNRKLNLEWTDKEDELLENAVLEHGHSWTLVAEAIENRTKNACKSRWRLSMTRKPDEPEPLLQSIQSPDALQLSANQQVENVNENKVAQLHAQANTRLMGPPLPEVSGLSLDYNAYEPDIVGKDVKFTGENLEEFQDFMYE